MNSEDTRHAGPLCDGVEEPPHDRRHLVLEHAVAAGNGVEAVDEEDHGWHAVLHGSFEQRQQAFRLEDEVERDLANGDAGFLSGGRDELGSTASRRTLDDHTCDRRKTPRSREGLNGM